jgi:hypothetical protein
VTAAAVTTDTVPKLSLWNGELRSRRQASVKAAHALLPPEQCPLTNDVFAADVVFMPIILLRLYGISAWLPTAHVAA